MKASFYDGNVAVPRDVEVRVHTEAVHLFDEAGNRLTTWPIESVYVEGDPQRDESISLVNKDHPEQYLTIGSDQLTREKIRSVRLIQDSWYSWLMNPSDSAVKLVLLFGLIASAVALMVLAVPLLSGPMANLTPSPVRARLGDYVSSRITGNWETCGDTEAIRKLGQLSEELYDVAGVGGDPRVHLIDSSIVNAFAAPGGRIVMFNGLIQKAEDPNEVSGVMAHEVAHAVSRHPTEGLYRSQGYRVLLTVITGDASLLSNLGQVVLETSHSREDELEADRLGVELLNRAGYSSRGIETFFQRLNEGQPDLDSGILQYISTHPSFERRMEQLEQLTGDGNPVFDSTEWTQLRQACGEPAD